jgi:hypothetical protein
MRYFDEYCEVHLDPSIAPYTWVFKSHEKIQIRFGVQITKEPDFGQLVYQLNDGKGYYDADRILVQTESVNEHGYKMFFATLPSINNGGGYRYQFGYVDKYGNEYTSSQTRTVLVCDEAPRAMAEIPYEFLGYWDNQPLYGPKPQITITSGPDNWAARLFYSIIIDRFSPGSSSNYTGLSPVKYDPTSPFTSHGGTIRGITEQIDYLKSLGIRAIIISPVYVNAADGYHGYHPIHLLMVDPRFGTLDCLRELVQTAHGADIAVILDVVNNHIADSINWEDYGGPVGGEFKYIQGEDDILLPFPVEARNTNLFHGPEYTDMVNQRLFGFLEDWRTETGYVRELLIQHLKYWISETDIDGLRYDSARHVGLDFWEPCFAEISRYTSFIGKKQFLQIAEHAGSTHAEVLEYNSAKFTNMIDYPTYYAIKKGLANVNWLGTLADYFCGFLAPTQSYHAGWWNNIMFLDNQDTTRILHHFLSHLTNQDEARVRLHFALACLILGPQIPAIYQGTEQEFSGALGLHQRPETGDWIGHDCYVREDLFDNPVCVWEFGPINHKTFPPFNTTHQTFLLIRQLAEIRSQNKLIQSGNRTLICSRNNGLWCLLIHGLPNERPLFVAMNLGSKSVFEECLRIPNWYGDFSGVDMLVSTSSGVFHIVDDGIQIKLPPFTLLLGKLL